MEYRERLAYAQFLLERECWIRDQSIFNPCKVEDITRDIVHQALEAYAEATAAEDLKSRREAREILHAIQDNAALNLIIGYFLDNNAFHQYRKALREQD